jgi:hypothetical protein
LIMLRQKQQQATATIFFTCERNKTIRSLLNPALFQIAVMLVSLHRLTQYLFGGHLATNHSRP